MDAAAVEPASTRVPAPIPVLIVTQRNRLLPRAEFHAASEVRPNRHRFPPPRARRTPATARSQYRCPPTPARCPRRRPRPPTDRAGPGTPPRSPRYSAPACRAVSSSMAAVRRLASTKPGAKRRFRNRPGRDLGAADIDRTDQPATQRSIRKPGSAPSLRPAAFAHRWRSLRASRPASARNSCPPSTPD